MNSVDLTITLIFSPRIGFVNIIHSANFDTDLCLRVIELITCFLRSRVAATNKTLLNFAANFNISKLHDKYKQKRDFKKAST